MKHGLLATCLLPVLALGQAGWFHRKHKSADELSRMDGAALVQEFCSETRWNAALHAEYQFELRRWILKRENVDSALHAIIQILEDYVPDNRSMRSNKRLADAGAALQVLTSIDGHAVRVRGIPTGRLAIESYERYLGRKAAAGEGNRNNQGSRPLIFEAELRGIEPLKGVNWFDHVVQRNLKVQNGIEVPDFELRLFVDFLIAKDPYYPSWSETYFDRDPKTRQFVGAANIRQLAPYVEALSEFRAANKVNGQNGGIQDAAAVPVR